MSQSNCPQRHWLPSCHCRSNEQLGICDQQRFLTGLRSLARVPCKILGPVRHMGKLTVGVNMILRWRSTNGLTMVHVVIKTMIPQTPHSLTTKQQPLEIASLVNRETNRRAAVRFNDHPLTWRVVVVGVSVVDGQNWNAKMKSPRSARVRQLCHGICNEG